VVCTPFLEQIEAKIEEGGTLRENYLSALHRLRASNKIDVWRKIDSHLTPYGTRVLYADIANALGHPEILEMVPDHGFVQTGDLARRFFGLPAYETVLHYKEEDYVSTRKKTFESLPTPKHIGSRTEWINPEGPIKKRVISFGNSFMAGEAQNSLSYWLSAACSEYNFTFSSEMDLDYIEKVKPDCVIFQTIERFLEVVPAS
jgi:hypothetical protein